MTTRPTHLASDGDVMNCHGCGNFNSAAFICIIFSFIISFDDQNFQSELQATTAPCKSNSSISNNIIQQK